MASKTHYHMITRVLVIAAIVAVLPLTVGFFLIQHSAKTRLSDAAGANFTWFADYAASVVDAAFVREFEFLGSIARSPVMDASLRSRGEETSSAAMEHLASLERTSAVYRHLAVLDASGDVVAASEPVEASSFAKDRGFREARTAAGKRKEGADGWAEVANGRDLLIVYRPVRKPDSDELLGFVRAEMDTERLFVAISDLRIGETGYACLHDRDTRRLLAGRTAECAKRERYARSEEFERARRQGDRYFLAAVAGPASFDRADALLVAHSRPELSLILPDLDWALTVEQSLAETHAPLVPMVSDLLLYFAGMSVLVVLLAGYVSFKLERPVTDIDIDLHHDIAPENQTSRA